MERVIQSWWSTREVMEMIIGVSQEKVEDEPFETNQLINNDISDTFVFV